MKQLSMTDETIVNDGMKETVIPDLIGDLNMKTNSITL